MDRVDRSPVRPEEAGAGRERDGGRAVFAQAGFVLGDLLGHVHVDWQTFGTGPRGDVPQIVERDGADAVRSNAESDIVRHGAGHLVQQRIHVGEEFLGCFEEARLAGIAWQLEPGSQVGAAEQYDADPD